MNGCRAIIGGTVLLLPIVLTMAVEKEPLRKIDLSPEPKVKLERAMAVAPNGSWVAGAQAVSPMAGRPPFELRVWDAANGKEIAISKDKLNYEVMDLQFAADGRTVLTSSGRLLTERRPPRREDRGKPPGNDVLRTSTEIKLWDVETGKVRCTLALPFAVGLYALSPDGQSLALEEWAAPKGPMTRPTGDFTVIRLYDVSANKPKLRATLPSANEPVACCTGIRFSPNSKHLAAVLCKRKGLQFIWEVAVWDSGTGKSQGNALELKDTPQEEFQVERLTWSQEPPMFAVTASRKDKSETARASYSTGIWEASAFRDGPRATIKHEDPLSHLLFSPDGKLALTVSRFGQKDEKPFHYVQLWEVASGKELPVPGHKDMKGDITAKFSPDSALLALADSEGRLKLWDIQKGAQLITYEASLPARFDPLVFSPDSKALASVERRNTVKLWDATTGKEVATFTPTIDFTLKKDLRFSPDGKKLIAFDGKAFTQWETETK